MLLTDRQLFILQVIVDEFIRSAQPVGSSMLSKKDDITFSSATIRNEMVELEKKGLIEKTHSSSGRVPSEYGYRYYVDHILSPQKLHRSERSLIHSIFNDSVQELGSFIQKSARILSDLTNYTSIVLGPSVKEMTLKKLQIVPLTNETAVAILITDKGHVENRMIHIPNRFDVVDIERFVNILNERLTGIPLIQLNDKLYHELNNILLHHVKNYEDMFHEVLDTLQLPNRVKLFFGGKSNMLNQPEFKDVQSVRSLMEMIESEQDFYQLFQQTPTGIHVKIGKENQLSELENCSFITTTYSIANEPVGTIAILGPTRMEYSRVISLLDILSNDMSRAFTKLYRKE